MCDSGVTVVQFRQPAPREKGQPIACRTRLRVGSERSLGQLGRSRRSDFIKAAGSLNSGEPQSFDQVPGIAWIFVWHDPKQIVEVETRVGINNNGGIAAGLCILPYH